MQSTIAETGIVEVVYVCYVCPHGCELKDKMADTKRPMIHNHSCHHFPSLTTAWKRIA